MPTDWRSERIRSYLRGRLGLAIEPIEPPPESLPQGREEERSKLIANPANRPPRRYRTRPLSAERDGRVAPSGCGLSEPFEGTLQQIAEHFGVTVPADITEGS